MSIKEIIQRLNFGNAIQRWPISSLISALISMILITWIYQENLSDQSISTYLRTVLAMYVGFLVSIITPLALVKTTLNSGISLFTTAGISIIAGAISYYILPSDVTVANYEVYWLGYAYPMQIIILHLVISYAAFWKSNSEETGFLNWNIKLLRIVFEGLLFFAVLMLGLSLALLALDHLFGFPINEKAYLYLTVLLLGVFHPWFVLSKTSKNPNKASFNERVLGFRILTQYVLIPITILYMVILYLYGVKIGIEGALPQGWLVKLSLGFCSVSLLTFVLNSPLKEISNKKIGFLFHQYLPIVLIIPVSLLLIALGRRIQDYGITENRYIVAGLAVWLLIIAILYAFKKQLSIKWIPISLSFLILFQLISGPINVFNTSIRSQEKRLTVIFEKAGLLENGQFINRSNAKHSLLDLSSLRYLSNRTHLKNLTLFSGSDIDWNSMNEEKDQYSFVSEQLQLQNKEETTDNTYVFFEAATSKSINIAQYEKAIPFRSYDQVSDGMVQLEESHLEIILENDTIYKLMASKIYTYHLNRNKNNTIENVPLNIEINPNEKWSISQYNLEVINNIPKIRQCSGILFYTPQH